MFGRLHVPEPGIGTVFKRKEYPVEGKVTMSTCEGTPIYEADAVIEYGWTPIYCQSEQPLIDLYKSEHGGETVKYTFKADEYVKRVKFKFEPDAKKSIMSVSGKARISSDMCLCFTSSTVQFELIPVFDDNALFSIEV